MSSRRRPLRALALTLVLGSAGWACGGDSRDPVAPLFAEADGVEVLVEDGALGGPTTEAANRFYLGWRPASFEGREAFQSVPTGAGFLVVTLPSESSDEASPRTLWVDLATAGAPAGHVEVEVAGRPPFLLPLADPLRIPLPADLPAGRHLISVRPRSQQQPPLVALGAELRPAPRPAAADLDGGDLVQTGRSLVDVFSRPGAGAVLTGELCPARRFSGTGDVSVEVLGADGHASTAWSGGGGLGARIGRCRRIELPPLPADEPVRVRFGALDPETAVRWQEWGWYDAATAARGESIAPDLSGVREPPRLVVLYLLDALRADALGHLGGPDGASPVLDRLAREGHTFREHRSTAPNTLLSLRHLFPGRILVNADAWKGLGSRLPLLAEVFQEAGYRTGLFSGNGYLAGPFGLDRGFDHVSREVLFEGLEGHEPGVNRNAEEVHAAALEWLDGLPPGSRVFLYLHTIHPHNPYSPPADLERRFAGGIPSGIEGTSPVLRDLARGRRTASPADRERLRALYAASLAYNDARIDRLLAALRERYDETEIVLAVTSDHGEELFDHGGVLHGYTLYEELLRVPLVVWAPGRVPPGETGELTDSLDLHATLVDLLGTGRNDAASEGRSLLGRWLGRGDDLPPRLHFAASDGPPGGAFAVRWGRWKHVWVRGNRKTWAMGLGPARTWDREYLFDLAADPHETVNLAGTGGVLEQWLRARLRGWVEARLAEGRDGAEAPPEAALDEATERRLRALGYID